MVVVLNHFANLVRVAKLDGISHFVMAYGGLRGAIAFSLAVVLDRRRFHSRQLFITTTIVVVYFTNIVLVSNAVARTSRSFWPSGSLQYHSKILIIIFVAVVIIACQKARMGRKF